MEDPGSIAGDPVSCANSSHRMAAAIDVGTNSVKLLVAKVIGREVVPVNEESKQTRLGSGFYQTHRLQSEPIAATAEAVAVFAAKARSFGVSSIRVIGTSAARDAVNSAELIAAIQQKSNLVMEVISGEQEANWAFHGVTSDKRLASQALLILDIGGGSSEFIIGENCVKSFGNSYRLGTVRTLESLKLHDPPGMDAKQRCLAEVAAFIRQRIVPDTQAALRACGQPPQLIATGGTATILARMARQMEDFNRESIESLRLSLDEVRATGKFLWENTLERRQRIPGLPPKRADVILVGVVIYQAIMEEFGFAEFGISTRGLRYSALFRE